MWAVRWCSSCSGTDPFWIPTFISRFQRTLLKQIEIGVLHRSMAQAITIIYNGTWLKKLRRRIVNPETSLAWFSIFGRHSDTRLSPASIFLRRWIINKLWFPIPNFKTVNRSPPPSYANGSNFILVIWAGCYIPSDSYVDTWPVAEKEMLLDVSDVMSMGVAITIKGKKKRINSPKEIQVDSIPPRDDEGSLGEFRGISFRSLFSHFCKDSPWDCTRTFQEFVWSGEFLEQVLKQSMMRKPTHF